jgi:D-alanyl-D-alanine dipeptidase
MRFGILLAAAVVCNGCATARPPGPPLSPATTPEAAGLVDIRDLVPDIAQDIRYAGTDNFVGARVDGYEAPKCWLLRPVAEALARLERALREDGLRLLVFDCYRPVRAVRHFVRWAQDPSDQRTKARHYPELPKHALLGDYIAPVSGHSRGTTLDLTLLRCANEGACTALDMGTPFDWFGPRANTDSPGISAEQRANRQLLRVAMQRAGFANYPREWWHYTYKPEPAPRLQYDVPIR